MELIKIDTISNWLGKTVKLKLIGMYYKKSDFYYRICSIIGELQTEIDTTETPTLVFDK